METMEDLKRKITDSCSTGRRTGDLIKRRLSVEGTIDL